MKRSNLFALILLWTWFGGIMSAEFALGNDIERNIVVEIIYKDKDTYAGDFQKEIAEASALSIPLNVFDQIKKKIEGEDGSNALVSLSDSENSKDISENDIKMTVQITKSFDTTGSYYVLINTSKKTSWTVYDIETRNISKLTFPDEFIVE